MRRSVETTRNLNASLRCPELAGERPSNQPHTGCSHLYFHLPKLSREEPNIFGERARFFDCREVTTLSHFGPTHDVVAAFDIASRGHGNFFWKVCDAHWYLDPLIGSQFQGLFSDVTPAASGKRARSRHERLPALCGLRNTAPRWLRGPRFFRSGSGSHAGPREERAQGKIHR